MRTPVLSFLSCLALAAAAFPAAAVTVIPCSDDASTASAVNIAEPWDKNSRTFSNGNIRVALVDTGGEPACCSSHLVILSPTGEQGVEGRACHLVNDHDGLGFVGLDLAKATTAYDPKKGLLLTLPLPPLQRRRFEQDGRRQGPHQQRYRDRGCRTIALGASGRPGRRDVGAEIASRQAAQMRMTRLARFRAKPRSQHTSM